MITGLFLPGKQIGTKNAFAALGTRAPLKVFNVDDKLPDYQTQRSAMC